MTESSQEKALARILICEDEYGLARDLTRTLMNLGYEVAGTVSSGKDADPNGRRG